MIGLIVVMLGIVGAVMLYRQTVKPIAVPTPSMPQKTEVMQTPTDSTEAQIQQLEAMWQKHPVHAPIALQLGNLHAEKHHHAEAIMYYRKFLELDTAQDAWEIRLDIAKEYYLIGKLDSSSIELKIAAVDHPSHPGVLYNLGALAANAGDTTAAREYWNRLMIVAPATPEAVNARDGMERLLGHR